MYLYDARKLELFSAEPYYRILEKIKAANYVRINGVFYISDIYVKDLFGIDVKIQDSKKDELSVVDVHRVTGLPYYAALGVVKELPHCRKGNRYFVGRSVLEEYLEPVNETITITFDT